MTLPRGNGFRGREAAGAAEKEIGGKQETTVSASLLPLTVAASWNQCLICKVGLVPLPWEKSPCISYFTPGGNNLCAHRTSPGPGPAARVGSSLLARGGVILILATALRSPAYFRDTGESILDHHDAMETKYRPLAPFCSGWLGALARLLKFLLMGSSLGR